MKLQSDDIIAWLRTTYGDRSAVIAVSGGVDSALALTLLTKALGTSRVYPLMLPYGEQDMADAETIVDWNGVGEQATTWNIQPTVDQLVAELGAKEPLRKGNLMARVRMIAVFDQAKKLGALVCGTENKSEHYLGYFTRFGDAASDVEPLSRLYKTEVWAMAKALGLPAVFYTKAPSAGLWDGQADEVELGFSYQAADQVLSRLVDEGKTELEVTRLLAPSLGRATVERILAVVAQNAFKRVVPYELF